MKKKITLLSLSLFFMGLVFTARAQTPGVGNILYVDKNVPVGGNNSGNSWANAIPELADALKYAREQYDADNAVYDITPLQIYVAKGTYKPLYSATDGEYTTENGRYNAFVLVSNVQLYGGFSEGGSSFDDRDWQANPTILSGDFNDDDEITGYGATLSITNNNDNAYMVVFSVGDVKNALLDGFNIIGGSSAGIAGSRKVNGESISLDFGGGIGFWSSSPTINNLYISGNHSNAGAGVYSANASPLLTNVLISKNLAAYNGGGMVSTGGSSELPELVNVTISGNKAAFNGGGIQIFSPASLKLYNSIVWGNGSAPSIGGAGTLHVSSTNNLIEGGGEAFDVSDIFTNPANDDYSLKASSPAINVGDNSLFSGLNATTLDLAGNPRTYNDGLIDLGAYEYQGDPVVLPVTLIDFTAKADGNRAKLQWQTAMEQNNKDFKVYRSGDDGKFVKIGEVAATATKNYIFYHYSPLNGNNYYKLVQVDDDGKTTDLGVRTVNFSLPIPNIRLFPNPAADFVTLSFTAGAFTQLQVIDLNGRILQQYKLNGTQSSKQVSLTAYPVGTYTMRLIGSEKTESRKVVKR